MNRFRGWLQTLGWRWIVPLAIFAALAPWPFGPEPHVVQKVGYLIDSRLTRPIDIFDLVFHLSPTLLLIAKLAAGRPQKQADPESL